MKYESGNGGLLKGGNTYKGNSGSSKTNSYKSKKISDSTKRKLKTVAIGVGTAAAVAGGVYLAKKGGYAKSLAKRKKLADAHMAKAVAARKEYANDLRKIASASGKDVSALRTGLNAGKAVRSGHGVKIDHGSKTQKMARMASTRYMDAKIHHEAAAKNALSKYGIQHDRKKIDRWAKAGYALAVGAGVGSAASYSKKKH